MSITRPWSWLVAGLLATSVGCSTAPAADAQPPAVPTTTAATASSTQERASGSGGASAIRTTHGSFAPYSQTSSSVVRAPKGFEPFYLQDVGRHGSRATVSSKPVTRVRALCAAAGAAGELTTLGQRFCADVAVLGAAMSRLGYGDLSPRGQQEWQGIGVRTAKDYHAFFVAAAKAKAPIRFTSSKSTRAKDSSNALRAGVKAGTPGLKLDLRKRTTTDSLLRFSTPLTPAGRAEIDRVEQASGTQTAASHALRRLFGSDSGSLGDAKAVWELYAIAGGMSMDLDGYLTSSDAAKLAALNDAATFYHYGPGVEGNTAFTSAAALRDDILNAIERHRSGDKTMATFRHGHAETVAPLAALLRLGPTNRPVAPGTSASANGWRGSSNVRMASNIDLAAYKKGRTVLVTVRYNERPIKILDCKSSRYGRYFYDFDTLKQCWS